MTLRYLGIMIFGLLAIACILGKSYDQRGRAPMDDMASIADAGSYFLAKPRWKPNRDAKFVLIDTSLLTTDVLIFMLFGIVVPFGYLTPFFLIPRKCFGLVNLWCKNK